MSALSYYNEPAPLAWDVAAAIFGFDGVGSLYDPSSLDTLFQDSAGTTPAVPGSPVGLVLDARQELGPELVENGDYSSGTEGWSPGGTDVTLHVVDGDLILSTPNANAVVEQIIATEPGKSYLISYDWKGSTGGNGRIAFGSAVTAPLFPSEPSKGSFIAIATATTTRLHQRLSGGGAYTATFGKISVREAPGNHLSQPTTAARPILARMPLTGRRNLLERTEEFDNSYWAKNNVTLTAGSSSASAIVTATAANGSIYKVLTTGSPSGTVLTNSIEIRRISGSGNVELKSPSNSPNVISVTSDWQRVSRTGGQSTYDYFVVALATVGDAVEIRFPQAELGSEPTPYQRVTNAYDVTEAGVPDTYSLVYDLADDNLTTTLPQAINGDILIAGTKGSIIEPVSYAAGSTFTLGPDTYTGGTPGIMRAIGNIVGVVLIDRTLTQSERENLLRHYKGKGAKGLLVPGPELVTNPNDPVSYELVGGSEASLTVEDGWLKVTRSAITTGAYLAVSGAGFYHYAFSVKPGTVNAQVRIGTGFNQTAYLNAVYNSETERQLVIEATSTTPTITFGVPSTSAGDTTFFRDLSIRELRPQEDW